MTDSNIGVGVITRVSSGVPSLSPTLNIPPLEVLCLGDCRIVLAVMDPKSVHLCITSPPFYAKRKYANADEQQAIWGDNAECKHLWQEAPPPSGHRTTDTFPGPLQGPGTQGRDGMLGGAFCARCGAWRGALGHEPTPDLFVAHLVECFRAVKRVLRDDGVLVVEIGDSYAGSAAGNKTPSGISQKTRPLDAINPEHNPIPGIPAQTRIGIPERFVLAMAADGWRWRDALIWRHTSAMPESVHGWSWQRCRVKVKDGIQHSGGTRGVASGTFEASLHTEDRSAEWADCPSCPKCEPNGGLVLRQGQWRTTVAHSYVYVFSKTNRYYGDGEAVRQVSITNDPRRPYTSDGAWQLDGRPEEQKHGGERRNGNDFSAANLRSVLDIGPEPFSLELCAACRHVYKARDYARLPKRDGKRVCGCGSTEWVSHYATFPTKLPELFIRAFTSDAGCCPKCGANWVRVIERTQRPAEVLTETREVSVSRVAGSTAGMGQKQQDWAKDNPAKTLGWRPTCACNIEGSVPCTILDPFVGTGSTLVAAKRNGRVGWGIDVSQDYLDLASERLRG